MEHIDHIFYINLDRRTDRREQIEEEFRNFDFPQEKITRFKAIEDVEQCIGCSKSHLAILKIGEEQNYENIIIFEDDFQFIIDKNRFHDNLHEFFAKYREKFDVLMLSYNLQETKPIDELVGYSRKAQSAAGYIVSKRIFPELIDAMEIALEKLIETHHHWLYVNDVCWFPLQKTKEWYYFIERPGIQRAGYSDLADKYVEYCC